VYLNLYLLFGFEKRRNFFYKLKNWNKKQKKKLFSWNLSQKGPLQNSQRKKGHNKTGSAKWSRQKDVLPPQSGRGSCPVRIFSDKERGVFLDADVRTFWCKKLRIFQNLWCVRMLDMGGGGQFLAILFGRLLWVAP